MSELLNVSSELNLDVAKTLVMSCDPEERKLARRLRVQRKTEVLRWKQLEVAEDETEVVEKTLLESQVEESENQLQKLLTGGNELVTNVRVANDAREVRRRAENAEDRHMRLAKLKEELALSTEKLSVINSKWDNILGSNDPLDFYHEIAQQKEKCNELIKQKDAVIEELSKELSKQEERFIRDQKKQREDVTLLCERMDKQVAVMRRSFREELKMIEDVVGAERGRLLEKGEQQWTELMGDQERLEQATCNRQLRTMQALEQQMQDAHVQQEERHRSTRIQLEEDLQLLQRELQHVKAVCLLNTEKLDYNYQVLRRRDHENTLLQSRHKRRITRLQDTVNNLKQKIAEKDRHVSLEKSRLSDDVKRLKCNITAVEKKGNDFTNANDKKFQQVWDLNTERAKTLLNKILTADRIIHEQQLGLEWMPPKQRLLQKADLESYRSAMQVVAELFRHKDRAKSESEHEKYMKAARSEQAEELFLRLILQKLADASGFMMEDRLKKLLHDYPKQEQTLITIDTVFSTLGVTSKRDMSLLKKYFIPYCYCTQCGPTEEVADEEIGSDPGSEEDNLQRNWSELCWDQIGESHQQDAASSTTVELPAITGLACDELLPHDDGAREPLTDTENIGFKPRHICIEQNHSLAIDEIYILKALREFVEKFNEQHTSIPAKPTLLLCKKRTTVSRLLTAEDVVLYWNRFLEVFDREREELWDALYVGLLKYRELLEDRHTLNEKTKRLRVQNAELKRLLHAHMKEKNEDKSVKPPAEFIPPHDEVRMTTKTVNLQKRSKKFAF